MKKLSFCFILFCGAAIVSAQKDSISIEARFSTDQKSVEINQTITYYNLSDKDLTRIKLLNWTAAYQNKGTALVMRKLEDRNNSLHFSTEKEGGKIADLTVKSAERKLVTTNLLTDENLFYDLDQPLKVGDSIRLQLHYWVNLPPKKYTGYGVSEENIALKYFFIVPDHFDPDNISKRSYLDMEESVNFNTHWNVQINLPNNTFAESNLEKISDNTFVGDLDTDPEFIISKQKFHSTSIYTDDMETNIKFGYALSASEIQNLEFFLPLHLNFIKEKLGFVPKEIFISEKFRKKEDFFGNNDIKLWKYQFKLFSDAEQIDLDYFGIIAKKILDDAVIADKSDDHWFKNGIKTYLEIQYLQKFYKDTNLLGKLPETKVLGIKPLKLFHASKVKLIDRYGLAYQYIMSQNLDQKIDEPFSALSNFNDMAISQFEMGTLFKFSADKMGDKNFDSLLKDYISNNVHQPINPEEFLSKIAEKESSLAYLSEYIQHKNRINFNIKNFRKKEDSLEIKIAKNTIHAIPVKVETETKSGEKTSFWVDTKENERIKTISVPSDEVYKITLNDDYSFPENNFRDNYIYTHGFFSHAKKIKLKFIKDIPNPEYNEIYLNPRIKFSNTYDKFLIGINFKNQSLFDQKFLYSITPSFSTGTGKLTGSGAVSYSFLPAESIFRSITFGVSGSYFHYNYDLAYRKGSLYTTFNFRKNPRSTVSRGISASYNYFERDLSDTMIANKDYDKYNLWSLGYGFTDNQMIHEKSFSISTQGMEDFNKINAEAFYRWEFAPKQKLSIRLFAGYFLRNDTRNNTFDYGISRVSNYSFSYNLLGESANSGILSQQFLLADGGFKSFLPGTVNHWLTSLNVDTSVWKIFHLYADAGFYKNKNNPTEFIWDSGVKVRLIPDFLEIYLPVQSSLGFEPGFKDYGKRIRYTLILNLSTIINAARRGWY
ncbi:aminopeptidase [Chryseobacterium sp.]|uniref:aminopeptidase n=1 Tax=Chryseobacterium sp. TaxID=1871047 RepID=UPI00388FB6B7